MVSQGNTLGSITHKREQRRRRVRDYFAPSPLGIHFLLNRGQRILRFPQLRATKDSKSRIRNSKLAPALCSRLATFCLRQVLSSPATRPSIQYARNNPCVTIDSQHSRQ